MAKNLRCARQPAQHTRFEPDRSHGGALHARILVSPAALLARQGATRDGILLDGTAPHRAHWHAPRSPARRSAPPRSMAPTRGGIKRDGSSLDAVELPPL